MTISKKQQWLCSRKWPDPSANSVCCQKDIIKLKNENNMISGKAPDSIQSTQHSEVCKMQSSVIKTVNTATAEFKNHIYI